jgi:hypothetical protein
MIRSTVISLFFIVCTTQFATAQFTEPREIPNGSTLTSYANVVAVKATGNGSSWNLSVTIESPDSGCEQYADWWEVLDDAGHLLYRRILTHSHIEEQPFTRSTLQPIATREDQVLWVRAHMNNAGYGGLVLKGSPKSGFKRAELPAGLGSGLEKKEPLPKGCRF